jgi:hypothetical protein
VSSVALICPPLSNSRQFFIPDLIPTNAQENNNPQMIFATHIFPDNFDSFQMYKINE